MKQGADWLAWSLQFVLGLVVGGMVGLGLISRGRRGSGWWLREDLLLWFVLGTALMGAALASWYGDRLWLSSSSGIIGPDGVRHSRASRWVSILMGAAGGMLAIISLLVHFGVF